MRDNKDGIQIVLFDWFGVVNGELTKLLIASFGLDADQQTRLRELNEQADSRELTVEQLHSAYGLIMAEIDGKERTATQVKDWLDANSSTDKQLLDTINRLRGHDVICVVASNAGSDHKVNMLNMGMADYFDELYVSSLIGFVKPNQDFFDYILEDWSIEPSNALFIDDTIKNVEGAWRAGLRAEKYGDYGDHKMAMSIFEKYNLLQ